MAASAPYGLSPTEKLGTASAYYIAQSDTNTYAIGDVVRTAGGLSPNRLPDGSNTQGLLVVTKCADGDLPRGVVVGISTGPGAPSSMTVPATKTQGYVIQVDDDPATIFAIQADNTVPLDLSLGSFAGIAVGAPSGSVSSTRLASATIGATPRMLRIREVLNGDAQNATLLVGFAAHELAGSLSASQAAATGVLVLSPSNANAAANTAAIQAAMVAGGRISILQEGLVPFVPPLILHSNCWLELGPETELFSRPVDPANSFSCIVSKMIQDRQNGLAVPVTFTWSAGSSTATLNWTAHPLAVGDYVWTQGALPGEFNVVAAVLSVTNANAVVIQLDDIPESVPTGTITALKADRNNRITGGRINYNAPINTASPGWRHYGLLLGGENVYVADCQGGQSVSQFLVFSAARNFGASRVHLPRNVSGIVQIQGCSTTGRFEQISAADSGDDGISISANFTDGFVDYQLSNGPVRGITIDGVNIRDRVGTGIVTIYPSHIYKTSGIKANNLRGTCIGGSAVKVFGYNAGTNPVLEDLEVDDVDVTAYSAVQFLCTAGCLSLTVKSFNGTRINNNHDQLSNQPFVVQAKVRILSGSAEIFQRNASWPGGAKNGLATVFGRLDDFRFKFIATNGVDGNVMFLVIQPDVVYAGKITVEKSHTKTGLVTECVRINTNNAFGVMAFKNNVLTTDMLVNGGAGVIPNIDFELSGNTLTDRGLFLGALRFAVGPTVNIRSDGTNRLLGGALFLTMPAGAVAARVYGWDIPVDPLSVNGSGNPLPAVAGQFFNSTRAGAVNQGPARSNAANFVALGTGAAGGNTVIS